MSKHGLMTRILFYLNLHEMKYEGHTLLNFSRLIISTPETLGMMVDG